MRWRATAWVLGRWWWASEGISRFRQALRGVMLALAGGEAARSRLWDEVDDRAVDEREKIKKGRSGMCVAGKEEVLGDGRGGRCIKRMDG